MAGFSRRTAIQIIYGNLVVAVMAVCIAVVLRIRWYHRFDEQIVRAAEQYEVDPRLVSALIWKESRFQPYCTGTKGEIGLMQVTETAAREWAKANAVAGFRKHDLFDPGTNILAGTWYLGRAIRRWSEMPDPLPYALAEYNAGRANAQRWARAAGPDPEKFWGAISYPTTKRYVHDILKRYRGGV